MGWGEGKGPSELEVLRAFRDAVESRIDGLPKHPWIPGVEFHDGEIIRLLELTHSVAQSDEAT